MKPERHRVALCAFLGFVFDQIEVSSESALGNCMLGRSRVDLTEAQRHRESEIWKWFSRSHLFLLRVLRVFARDQRTSLKEWISQRHRESKMMEMVLAIPSFLASHLRESPTAPETFDDWFQKATVKRSRLTGIPDGPIKGSNADRFIEQVDVLHRHANDHEGEEHPDQAPQCVASGGCQCLHRRLGSLLVVRR